MSTGLISSWLRRMRRRVQAKQSAGVENTRMLAEIATAADEWAQYLCHNPPPDVPFPSLLVAQCILKGEGP